MRIQAALSAITVAFSALAQPAFAQLTSELVASGLSQPVGLVQDPSQPAVQVVLQQGGRVRVIQNGLLLAHDFLDLSSDVSTGGEQGLLGLAFAPDYATSRRLYVNFTNGSGHTVVSRFLRDATNPLRADPSTRVDLVWPGGLPYIHQPFANHNGGHLAFGPDGFLYVGLGDGGSGSDPFHNAQNPATLLGKMLRIDVSVAEGHPTGYSIPSSNPFVGRAGVLAEIWAFGYRNPWRYSFDDPARGGTGAMVVGDVGQGLWEEVDYEPAGAGGRNYGWRNREGAHDHVPTEPPFSLPLIDPIYEYAHNGSGGAVTGGFVYRGTALGAGYYGRYFFADISVGRIWSLGLAVDPATGMATATDVIDHTLELGSPGGVSTFGVDAGGELYFAVYGSGAVYRIAAAGTPSPPSPPTGSGACTIPDPFTSLGGGTCCNGGWLPPGMVCGTATPGPPAPPANPPSSSPGVCTGPDPFSSLGGGSCCNGGWLPPGMVCSAPGSNPSTGPADPPPAPPASSPVSCATPDPFGSLGGGSCCDGGWLPPGMACRAAPSPPPPSPSGSCSSPDPFLGIPGLEGVCIAGGWVPVEVFTATGTVRLRSEEGGFWAIQIDDGRTVVPLSGVPAQFQTDGLAVIVTAKWRPDIASIYGAIVELRTISVAALF